MLTHLSIQNYAIASVLDISFRAGMTAITGETGAGKSIILGALGLVLGDRADRDVVRDGCERADITAEFDISALPAALAWLEDNALESGTDPALCLIRRTVGADGRSRSWINNTPVTLQALAALGELLMDIHSQHEHHSLLKKATHQQLLDDFAGHTTHVKQLRELASLWRDSHQRLQQLRDQVAEQAALNELARYQLNELEELQLGADELESLGIELDELSQADSRLAGIQSLMLICHEQDDGNIRQQLQQALHVLGQLTHRSKDEGTTGIASQLLSIEEMLNTALIQVEEAADEMSRLADRIDINPARLEQLNRRLNDIHQLARKHKVRPDELAHLQQRLQAQLANVLHNADQIQHLELELKRLHTEWSSLAHTLSQQRQRAADKLSAAVNLQLQALAMGEASLTVHLQPNESTSPQAHGLEQAEFLISTNRGQAARALSKIASGGELSRISLAIQVITAMTSQIPCLVFDEVDVGIGGAVARTVGKLLRQLGERGQVLCVTHQALVAGQAHQHYRVSKAADGDSAHSQLIELTHEQRTQEIARMLGGETEHGSISDESMAHARELLSA
ncbi:DNA repair protein RecN [Gammaproteobacteria bacterium LSUCC0112]|nr:DNA repair protein RecN [Gammaproteobacteria bacterium LSUCC0112]